MQSLARSNVTPVFIDGPSGRLFSVRYLPAHQQGASETMLYIPPFAEEMNRSRRMAALQARAFATQGVAALLLDLYGTGDSAGDFADASLERWLDDIDAAADWLERHNRIVTGLWGLRLGALLACAMAARRPERFKRLLLWQPVTDGKTMLSQFLRLRVAAAMGEGGSGEKTEDIRARLRGGQSVEVAGYELSAPLAQALDSLRMEGLHLASHTRVHWLEVAAEASDQLMPAGRRVVDKWRKTSIDVSAATVAGDPFWTLQETTLAPALLAATARLFEPRETP